MSLRALFSDGSPVVIEVPWKTRERLLGTCFRGTHRMLAGNFRHWNCLDDVFAEPGVTEQLLEHAFEIAEKDIPCVTHRECRASIVLTRDIGWESTGSADDYSDNELESCYLNERHHALRVRTDRPDIKAPLTREFTVVYDLHLQPLAWCVVVKTMYPGKCVGKLQNNMTERTGRVWFDWSHPGA